MHRALLLSLVPALALAAPCGADAPAVAWEVGGFSAPESVFWDAGAGRFYVSNMGADPMGKDGDGYLSALGPDGAVLSARWVEGLDAPKGMALSGGRLFVADVDSLVEIDTAAGAVVARHAAEGAVLLNDVAAAPDGRVFVSDTFANAVWVFEGGAMARWSADPALEAPNGLLVQGDALLVANLGDLSQGFEKVRPGWIVALDLATGAAAPYAAAEPLGVLDGLEADGTGGVIATDWATGRILRQMPGGEAAVLATLATGAADHAHAADLGLIVVPVTPENRVVALRWTP